MPVWVLRVLSAARKVPWTRLIAAVVWLATAGRKYWNRLTTDDRREVFDLLRKSKGQRSNLIPSFPTTTDSPGNPGCFGPRSVQS
jgi:hypothetical protein